jgi:cellulose synthase/poly-beta-1,6-N-acetylglucosamine synthase-like glycosyltransferase
MNVAAILFWTGVVWILYVYAGYPSLLWLAGLFEPFRPKSQNSDLPRVSVLISARNEVKDIGWKIAETLSWDYPSDKLELLIASDASTDGTDEVLKAVDDARLRYLRLEPRQGKNEALNRLVNLAEGEILFFSDANSHIDKDCLRNIVRHFADHRVGCVTGVERTIRETSETGVTSGTRAALGYESVVNKLESQLGSVLVCDGSLFCIRRELFTTLQPDLANDFELPIRIASCGHAILFDPAAISLEKSTSSPREEFQRKRRICGQGILGFWRLRRYLSGIRAWQFFSRKFLRWFGAVPLFMAFIASAMLFSRPFYEVAFGLQAVFYCLAVVGWILASRGRQGTRATTFPFFFVMVHFAALTGVMETLSGKRFAVWESAGQSRGLGQRHPMNGQAEHRASQENLVDTSASREAIEVQPSGENLIS